MKIKPPMQVLLVGKLVSYLSFIIVVGIPLSRVVSLFYDLTALTAWSLGEHPTVSAAWSVLYLVLCAGLLKGWRWSYIAFLVLTPVRVLLAGTLMYGFKPAHFAWLVALLLLALPSSRAFFNQPETVPEQKES